MADRYDVIVVGARVAGVAAAARLARAGLRVLLLDRAGELKAPLSSPLYFSNALDQLDRLGILDRVELLGAPSLHLYNVNFGDIHLRGHLLPYRARDYAYSIQRERFDQVLFDWISSTPNVEARLACNVAGLLWDETHSRVIGVRASAGGGREEQLAAEVVVGADGFSSVVAREAEAERYDVRAGHTCVYFAYYSGVKPGPDGPSASIYAESSVPLYAIAAESDQDLTVVSLILPAPRFEEIRRDPDNVHVTFIPHVPELADRMRGARRETRMLGVAPRESFYRVPYGPGWVLVGDAGYYKDPLTGQGIYDALRSAELACEAILESHAGGSWEQAMQSYSRMRDRETHTLYEFTDLMSSLDHAIPQQQVELIRAIADMPAWSDRYVSLFNGATDPNRFLQTPNLFRLLLAWRAVRLWRRITGRALTPSTAGSS